MMINCNILQLYKTAFKSTPQLIACENLEAKCTMVYLSYLFDDIAKKLDMK